jgi:hypothetical protein
MLELRAKGAKNAGAQHDAGHHFSDHLGLPHSGEEHAHNPTQPQDQCDLHQQEQNFIFHGMGND